MMECLSKKNFLRRSGEVLCRHHIISAIHPCVRSAVTLLIKSGIDGTIFVPVRSGVCADKIVSKQSKPSVDSFLPKATPKSCNVCPVKGLSLCESMHRDDVDELDALVTNVHYPARSTLFDQDGVNDFVHVVSQGMVRIFKILPDGRRLVYGFALPGDFIGLSLGDHHACSAEALGDVKTCRIERAAYERFLDSKPHLMQRFHAETVHELSIAQDQMMLLGRCNAHEKMAIFLLTMRARWQRINGHATYISLPMPRQDIADFLGMTIETASRMINVFARKKLIAIVPDGVRILNLGAIETMAAR